MKKIVFLATHFDHLHKLEQLNWSLFLVVALIFIGPRHTSFFAQRNIAIKRNFSSDMLFLCELKIFISVNGYKSMYRKS